MAETDCGMCNVDDLSEPGQVNSNLAKDYFAAGFGRSLGRGKNRALLLVDLTLAYLDEESPLYAGPHGACVTTANAKLLQAARKSRLPIIHTRIELQYGAKAGLFIQKVPSLTVFERGSRFALAPDELRPNSDEIVVNKQYASAFFGTDLAATLTSLNIDTLIIGGASTSGCVRASALDAMQHGFIPLVVGEACLDRDKGPHQSALFDLNEKYADVINLIEAQEIIGRPIERNISG